MFRILLAVIMSCGLLAGQDAVNKFRVRLATRLTGSDEFRITKSPEGILLIGQTRIEGGGIKGTSS